MTNGVARRTSIVLAVASVVLLILAVVPALGHAQLVSTTIEDGAVLDAPVDRIGLEFDDVVTPVSMRLLEGRSSLAGSVVQPTTSSVVVEPLNELRSGQYALLWRVKTLDDHVIEGTISFRIAVPGEAGAEAPPTTVAAEVAATPGPTLATTTTLPLVSTRLPAAAFVVQSQPEVDPATGDWIRRIGRWSGMTGALLAIGALTFGATALVGTRDEVAGCVRWVRRGGVLVLAGTVLEVVGASAMQSDTLIGALAPSALAEVLTGSFAVAILLRLIGGAALLQDPRMASVTEVIEPSVTAAPSTGGVATMVPVEPRYRLDLRQEWVAIAGLVAVALSFTFDGHSVSTDPELLVRAASFVHVLAGGVWFGGLVAMLAVITSRRAEGRSWEVALLSVRFSRVATGALVVVAIAGTMLTSAILSAPSDLLATSWGRLLLIKMGLVAVAAVIGGYNHFVVVPSLRKGGHGATTLQRTVMVEVIVLAIVIAVTAILVGLAA